AGAGSTVLAAFRGVRPVSIPRHHAAVGDAVGRDAPAGVAVFARLPREQLRRNVGTAPTGNLIPGVVRRADRARQGNLHVAGGREEIAGRGAAGNRVRVVRRGLGAGS